MFGVSSKAKYGQPVCDARCAHPPSSFQYTHTKNGPKWRGIRTISDREVELTTVILCLALLLLFVTTPRISTTFTRRVAVNSRRLCLGKKFKSTALELPCLFRAVGKW